MNNILLQITLLIAAVMMACCASSEVSDDEMSELDGAVVTSGAILGEGYIIVRDGDKFGVVDFRAK